MSIELMVTPRDLKAYETKPSGSVLTLPLIVDLEHFTLNLLWASTAQITGYLYWYDEPWKLSKVEPQTLWYMVVLYHGKF